MRLASPLTMILVNLLFSAAAASAQGAAALAQGTYVSKACHTVKDHYGKSHEDCRPRVEPDCHIAKNHYGKAVESCHKS